MSNPEDEPALIVAMRSHIHEFTVCSTDSELSLCPLFLVTIGFVQSQKVPIHGSTFPHLDHTILGSGNCINILDRPYSILHHVEILSLFLVRQQVSSIYRLRGLTYFASGSGILSTYILGLSLKIPSAIDALCNSTSFNYSHETSNLLSDPPSSS